MERQPTAVMTLATTTVPTTPRRSTAVPISGKPCGSGTDCASGLCVEARDGTEGLHHDVHERLPETPGSGRGPSTIDAGTNVCWPRFDFVCRPCRSRLRSSLHAARESTGDPRHV